MMIIEQLTAEHLEQFDFSQYGEEVKPIVEANAQGALVLAARDKGKVVALGGIVDLWPGVGEAWTIIAPCLQGQWHLWPPIHRVVKRAIQGWFCDCDGHRLQTSTPAGYENGKKWLSRLGFRYEGTMWQYGPDRSDFERWAIVKGEN